MIARLLTAALFGALALVSPTISAAQPVMDKPTITLDPTKAYVLYTTHRDGQAMELIRDPNADDIAAYTAERATALAKARRKYVSKLKAWESQSNPKTATPGVKAGDRPVEPTEANFAFPPIELDTMVRIGLANRFSKAGNRSVYLHEVVPGTYTVYGPILFDPNAAWDGTCLCLGTVRFVAEAGVITDLGYMVDPIFEGKLRDPFALPQGVTSFAIDLNRSRGRVDPRIGSFPIRPAAYRAAGKRSNWQGVAVDRLTEMPGVFRYERDKQIDLTGGAQ